ncbi:TPA: hypothetical protein I7674_21080 [Vibrio vulnificus]|nr:hypothetical protein [Vibrio vulnificus]HAS8191670.1 hypothetical protein [Vibrio vulnificus]
MNEKNYQYWNKARKQGFLVWAFKNTLIMTAAYITFNLLMHFPLSEETSIFAYIQIKALEYFMFPCLMLFAHWGIWLHKESKFKAEQKRRNIA